MAARVPALGFLERHVYVVALAGLAIFYGLERLAVSSRSRPRARADEEATSSGGVILNVLKEELPRERASRFWTFALGAAIYAGLLAVI